MTLEEISNEVRNNREIDSEYLYQEAKKYLQSLQEEERKKENMKHWHLLEMLGMMRG